MEGLSFEDLERTLSSESGILFPDLDRTITESDKGTHDGDSWMDGVSSIGSDIDSTSSEPQYPLFYSGEGWGSMFDITRKFY